MSATPRSHLARSFPRIYLGAVGTLFFISSITAQTAYIRVNQAGYLATDTKVGVAFSATPLKDDFDVLDATSKKVVFRGKLQSIDSQAWGSKFPYYYALDFTSVSRPGEMMLRL